MFDRARTIKRTDKPTENSRIYDAVYGYLAVKNNYKITNKYKSQLISQIFESLSDDEQRITKYMIKTKFNSSEAIRRYNLDMTEKQFNRIYDRARRRMYSPQNIALAINGYYDIPEDKGTPILETDFPGDIRVYNALRNSGFYYREQLYKHLNNGWYYLWTIPKCGDISRQLILRAIDNWEGRGFTFKRKRGKK
jgi:hypothetical protein